MRRTVLAACCAALAVAVGCTAGADSASQSVGRHHPTASLSAGTASPRGSAGPSASASPAAPWDRPPSTTGHLKKGSDPGALPGDVLIADKLNNRLLIVDPEGRVRWQFPRPGDLRHGQSFRIPDDAFFTPDGRDIIATEEDDFVIRIIDVATHRIVYRYGTPGVPGHTPEHLWNPDDAIVLPGGDIVSADIKNHRIITIAPGGRRIAHQLGTPGYGYHNPPTNWGAPNGAFPLPDGHLLVTEIRGDWVDDISRSGHVYWATHPPGVAYPSDTNQVAPNRYLTVDYSSPGQALIFDRSGHAIWRYRPSGRNALDHPSLALPLPDGNILLNDDFNHRVIVIDRRTKRIVWQYGHTGVAGRAPGYLDNPDGVDVVPPNSLVDRTTAHWPKAPGQRPGSALGRLRPP